MGLFFTGNDKDPKGYSNFKDELFKLHDIAEGLRLLRDITEAAPEMQLIQAELLIIKIGCWALILIREESDI